MFLERGIFCGYSTVCGCGSSGCLVNGGLSFSVRKFFNFLQSPNINMNILINGRNVMVYVKPGE